VDFVPGLTSGESLSRLAILETAREVQHSFGWIGSGPGSFEDVYRLFEHREGLDSRFVNHAHNDYFQVLIEFGILGGALLVFGLAWFGLSIVQLLRSSKPVSRTSRRMRLAFAISAAMPIFHSFLDYPIRTPAISVLFVFCLVLMSMSQRSA